MNTLEKVKIFHEKFGHAVKDVPDLSDSKLNSLIIDLLSEELEELIEAIEEDNTTKVLDALIDLQYVLDGAFLALGFHEVKEDAFNEVHTSNMSKLGSDGKPIYREDGKILKSTNYVEPDLSSIVLALEDRNENE